MRCHRGRTIDAGAVVQKHRLGERVEGKQRCGTDFLLLPPQSDRISPDVRWVFPWDGLNLKASGLVEGKQVRGMLSEPSV